MGIEARIWGQVEELRKEEHWAVTILTIMPGHKIEGSTSLDSSRIFQVIEGMCYITMSDGTTRVIRSGGSFVPPNIPVTINNPFDNKVRLLETAVENVAGWSHTSL